MMRIVSFYFPPEVSCILRNFHSRVLDQVRHKIGCTVGDVIKIVKWKRKAEGSDGAKVQLLLQKSAI